MRDGLLTLKLDPDTRLKVERALILRCQEAITGASARDMLLVQYEEQLEGITAGGQNLRWPGSCDLDDPLTREAHLQLLSLLCQAQRSDPKVMLDPLADADPDEIQQLEDLLADEGAKADINDAIYSTAYSTLRDPVGVMFVGYCQSTRPKRMKMHQRIDQNGDPQEVVSEGNKLPDTEYDEVIAETDIPAKDGIEFRTPDLADFYLYPPDAQSIEQALGCGERMLLTEEELLLGIETYGYDKKDVQRLIDLGPTHGLDGTTLRARQNQRDGTDGGTTANADGFYEVFQWWGTLPYLRSTDGEPELKKNLHHEDMVAMLCPDRNIVFKLDFNPYGFRPYVPFYIYRKPNRFLGTGICGLVEALQAEANANLRLTIDSADLMISPTLIAPKQYVNEFDKWGIYPGAILPEDEPNSIRPLELHGNPNIGMELQTYIEGRAQGLTAARGYGQLDDKQRKNGEMQNVLSATDAKFDLFLANFSSSLAPVHYRMLCLLLRYKQGQDVTIEELQQKFKIVPTASAQSSNPSQKLQVAQAKMQVAMQYWTGRMQIGNPQVWPYLYHMTRQLLIDLGERRPEQWIGDDPTAQVQQMMAAQQQAAMQAGQGGQPGQQTITPNPAGSQLGLTLAPPNVGLQ